MLGLAEAFDKKTDEYDFYNDMFSSEQNPVGKNQISDMKNKLKDFDLYDVKEKKSNQPTHQSPDKFDEEEY